MSKVYTVCLSPCAEEVKKWINLFEYMWKDSHHPPITPDKFTCYVINFIEMLGQLNHIVQYWFLEKSFSFTLKSTLINQSEKCVLLTDKNFFISQDLLSSYVDTCLYLKWVFCVSHVVQETLTDHSFCRSRGLYWTLSKTLVVVSIFNSFNTRNAWNTHVMLMHVYSLVPASRCSYFTCNLCGSHCGFN